MQDHELYRRILGIEGPWYVDSVELKLESGEVHVHLAHQDRIEWPCPERGAACKLYDHQGERRWRRLDTCLRSIPPCVVGLEATRGAHHWARVISGFGHEVRLVAPQFVKPYLKGQKNDVQDAAAICEAVSRPEMRFVPQKSVEQQDLQALHRMRSRLIGCRTQLGNQIRGLLAEYGIILPLHVSQIRVRLPQIIAEDHPQLSSFARELFLSLHEELCALDRRIKAIDERIQRVFREQEPCQRIADVEGVGPMIATAIVAAIADGRAFRNGRQFAAWLGLVPRQYSSGDKQRLGGISKRGDLYLRIGRLGHSPLDRLSDLSERFHKGVQLAVQNSESGS